MAATFKPNFPVRTMAAWLGMLVITLAGGVMGQSCVANTTTAVVSAIPSTATCVILYDSAWQAMRITPFTAGTASVTVTALPRQSVFFEFYRNSCGIYMQDGRCTVPATAAPTTAAPTTAAPTTAAPTTAAPTTAAPTTAAPTTAAPTTAAPTTAAPTTAAPTTAAPTTAAPTTAAPTTAVPTTGGPTVQPPPATAAPSSSPSIVYNGGPPPGQYRAFYQWSRGDCMIGRTWGGFSYQALCGSPNVNSFQDSIFNSMLRPANNTYAPYNHLLVEIPVDALTANVGLIQNLITRAHAVGIGIELLAADASWVLSTTSRQIPIQICTNLAAYNLASPPNARFDGLNLNIEPHILAGWTSNRNRGQDNFNDDYQDNLIFILRSCQNTLRGTGALLSWTASLFYHALVTDIWRPMVQDPFIDVLFVMNYYDNEFGFVNGNPAWGGMVKNLNSVRGSSIPIVFIADIMDPEWAPPPESFWQEGTMLMENMFGHLGYAYASDPNFKGFAVHALGSYQQVDLFGPRTPTRCTSSGRTITIFPDAELYVSVVIYRVGTVWIYNRAVSISGSSPYTVTATVNGPYAVELYDGPGGVRLSPKSEVGSAVCTVV